MTILTRRRQDESFLRARVAPSYTGAYPVCVVDLFCGCGGLTLGVAEAARRAGRGVTIPLAMEIDPGIRDVFLGNFGRLALSMGGDVRERFDGRVGQRLTDAERRVRRELGAVEILVGGPPCQGHSNLNNHTRGRDPKNELYMVMVRAAAVMEPAHVLIENVPGLRRDHSGVLPRAVRELERLGYRVDEQTVRLVDLGVPQLRVRHILVATRATFSGLGELVARHHLWKPRTVRWAIADLARLRPRDAVDVPATLSDENILRARYLLRTNRFDLPNRLRPPCHRDQPDHRYKSMYGRLRWDEPAQTITTGFGSPGQGRYLHPEFPRTLTPHEAARLQFFPDWFDFGTANTKTLTKCIGNAVPPKLAMVIAADLFSPKLTR